MQDIRVTDATMTGPERNAIKNRVIRVALSMASAKMGPAYAAKDGTEDIAHYVRKIEDYILVINSMPYFGRAYIFVINNMFPDTKRRNIIFQ